MYTRRLQLLREEELEPLPVTPPLATLDQFLKETVDNSTSELMVGPTRIGRVTSWSVSHDRPVAPVFELGSTTHIPLSFPRTTVNLERVVVDNERLMETYRRSMAEMYPEYRVLSVAMERDSVDGELTMRAVIAAPMPINHVRTTISMGAMVDTTVCSLCNQPGPCDHTFPP
jgi:hypothetical protein